MEVAHVTGADTVLERIEGLLLEDEARHNLALGILSTAIAHPGVYPELHGWVVRDGEQVVGAALRTPPHNLVLAMPRADAALLALADAMDDDLPGVVGALPEVNAFATAWAKRRGASVTPGMEQRIYALRDVRARTKTDGAMRLADESDRELLGDWIAEFTRETSRMSTDAGTTSRAVEMRLADPDGGFGLWEITDQPVSLACFGGTTPNGIRISTVYTPPEHRRRGYGSAITAAVSQLNLDRGHRFCFLYTDLANPTSNAIYVRIGYEPVCDSRELALSRL